MRNHKLLYGIYERQLSHGLNPERIPAHVGVILDGNRRWAKAVGNATSYGHRKGADKITEFLGWAREFGVQVVTLWMLSTDNLSRSEAELAPLLSIIVDATREIAANPEYRVQVVGDLNLLPEGVASELSQIVAASAALGDAEGFYQGSLRLTVNVAIGYGGRHEITDAVRSLLRSYAERGMTLEQAADVLTIDDISEHLYTAGVPDPDLLIRTSGEQRLSGFMLWQSVHSEFYFCEAFWPDFRRVDFLRALRDYGQRERRLGK
ncbi:di-trans,poly-cis-decaprenylcistransferase-like protein [Gleimia coleocanis DSM 15436]|uniref:Isoprenyl transferase n=1 Tax=Gleimia coleocanis DSM 15436 TaxID=525245 RepID=C0VZN1_9ACTO|nr:polyprenyl diphosphate synthase [Gleimia coleocanis]EEH64150.1 di-trans,poly-cis-decaprenylcistransferase-like protein [Gleimia coleocanis DSM 15436]